MAKARARSITTKSRGAASERASAMMPAAKADVSGSAAASAVVRDTTAVGESFNGYQVIRPTFPAGGLQNDHLNSNALRQNVDAYAVNIHGYGYSVDTIIDYEAEDVLDQVATQAYLRDNGLWDDGPVPTVTPADVAELEQRSKRERARIDLFLKHACSKHSWVRMTMLVRQDLEIMGFAFLEVRRDDARRLAGFAHVPGQRFVALRSKEPVEVEVPFLQSAFGWTTRTELRYGHLWGQENSAGQIACVFKPVGDPRLISNKTGKAYASIPAMLDAEPEARPATELAHFVIDHATSPFFGAPRWIGNYRSVCGSTAAENVNLSYFDNKSVPPLAVLVSGGTLTDEAVARLESYIEDELTGQDNFHKILILEALPADADAGPASNSRIRIELQPLTEAQQQDALFMKYVAKARDHIGEAMRNPRIVRGDIDGINRATAVAALTFAEGQVYAPERESFDWWVNNFILFELNCSSVVYRTNTPIATDIDTATAITELTKANVLVPAESRKFVARVFNTPLPTISDPWTKQPMSLTLAQTLSGSGGTGTPERESEGQVTAARKTAQLLHDGEYVDAVLQVKGPILIPDPTP